MSLLSRLQCPLHPLRSLHSLHSRIYSLPPTPSFPHIHKLTPALQSLPNPVPIPNPNPLPLAHHFNIIPFAFNSYSSSSSSSSLSSFSVAFQASPSNLKSSLFAPFIRLHIFTSSRLRSPILLHPSNSQSHVSLSSIDASQPRFFHYYISSLLRHYSFVDCIILF